MDDDKVRINITSLLMEFNILVQRNKSLSSKLDCSGDLVIDGDDLGNLSRDLAILLGRAMERIVEFE